MLQSVPVSFIHYLNRSSLNSMDSLAITSFIFLAAFLLFFFFTYSVTHICLLLTPQHIKVVKSSMSWPSNVCWPGDRRERERERERGKITFFDTLHFVFWILEQKTITRKDQELPELPPCRLQEQMFLLRQLVHGCIISVLLSLFLSLILSFSLFLSLSLSLSLAVFLCPKWRGGLG